MIDIEAIRLCVVATSIDRAVLLITFLSTLLFDLEKAIFIGVLLSLTLFIYKTAHPRVNRLHKGDPMLREGPAELPQGITVYMIEGTLFFGAIHELERLLYAEDKEPTRLVVLHLSRVFWIDASGAHALAQFIERCYARSLPVILVVGSPSVRTILRRTGLLEYLSNGFVAETTGEGLRLAAAMLNRFVCRDGQCVVADTSVEAGPATGTANPADSAIAATAATAGSAPDYMTQSARVALDAHGNVQPSESAHAEPATATPRATKERP